MGKALLFIAVVDRIELLRKVAAGLVHAAHHRIELRELGLVARNRRLDTF
jgi:hypothetical protein